jgi:hypothetical protein
MTRGGTLIGSVSSGHLLLSVNMPRPTDSAAVRWANRPSLACCSACRVFYWSLSRSLQ